MKIVHVLTAITGGAGIAAYRLHESFMQNVSDIDSYIVQSYPLKITDTSKHIERCTHFHSIEFRIKKRLGVLPYLSTLESYKRRIEKAQGDYDIVSLPFSYYPIHKHPLVMDADIIHLHWTCGFLDYKSFFSAIKQPIVWTLHDIYPLMGIYHFKNDKRKNKNTILDRIDNDLNKYKQKYIQTNKNIHIVCPSKWMYNLSKDSDTFKDYSHSIIPNGFDVESFRSIDRSFAKKTLGLDNGKKTIFFGADNIDLYGKGLDLLVDALKRIPQNSYNLISVGRGQIELIAGIGTNYKHLGFVQSIELLNIIYAAADVTIIPSREDSFNQIMAESILNGTPVISFNVGGMADHITTGVNGILVSDMTSESLANSITDFLEEKYIFDSLRIRQYALDKFDSKKVAQSYWNLYKSILDK